MKVSIVTMYGAKFDSRTRRMAQILDAGHEVSVVSVNKGEGQFSIGQGPVIQVNNGPRWLPRNVLGWVIKYIITAWRMTLVLRKLRPDVIQAEDADALPLVWFACKMIGSHLVYDAKELRIDSGKSAPNRLMRLAERLFIKSADIILAANEPRARYMSDYYKLGTLPTVIRNVPVQQTSVRPSGRLRAFLAQQGVTGAKVILYQGGIIPGRGLEVLVEAARRLPPEYVVVFLGGSNRHADQLRRLAVQCGCVNKVFFMERVSPEELLDTIADADLGVVLYQNKDLNNFMCASTKQYEYVSAGVPVVMPNFPHLVEFLDRYRAGISFVPSDPTSLVEAILEALGQFEKTPELLQRLISIQTQENWDNDKLILLKDYGRLGGGR